MDVATDLLRRGHGIRRGLADGLVVVLRKDEGRHQSTFASLRSLSTSAFASAPVRPPFRFAGSPIWIGPSRGETSTPSASGLRISSCFFFAFMMLGKVT